MDPAVVRPSKQSSSAITCLYDSLINLKPTGKLKHEFQEISMIPDTKHNINSRTTSDT